jgi:glycosyltransferase involved in cell wall biosynthesis
MSEGVAARDRNRESGPPAFQTSRDPAPAVSHRPRPGRRPQLAIVTITKNDPLGIRRTLASVAAQDCVDYEHVVVDGGSDPDVIDWLRKWESEQPGRRHLVTDPPSGIYPSMNEGIRQTSAPLILILNGGDEMTPGTLDRVVRHHVEHRWRWAYGGILARDAEGRMLGRYVFDPFRMPRFRAGWDVIPHPAAYVTRELHEEVGLYREDVGTSADQEFLLRAATVARPANIPGILAAFWLGGVSGQDGMVSRELAWHRLRCTSGTAFGGHVTTDAVATVGVLGLQVARWGIAKIRRTPYPFLTQEAVPQHP